MAEAMASDDNNVMQKFGKSFAKLSHANILEKRMVKGRKMRNIWKKMLSFALCAVMISSVGAVAVSADTDVPNDSGITVQSETAASPTAVTTTQAAAALTTPAAVTTTPTDVTSTTPTDTELKITWLDINATDFGFSTYTKPSEDGIYSIYTSKYNSTGKSGIVRIDSNTGKVYEYPQFDYIDEESEGLLGFYSYETQKEKDEYGEEYEYVVSTESGYINLAGEIVIKGEYESVRPFHEGAAIIRKINDGSYYNSVGLIDKQGNLLVDLNYISIEYIDDGVYIASKMDENGIIINGILKSDGSFKPIECDSLIDAEEGYILVVLESNKCYLADHDGNRLTPDFYSNTRRVKEGKITVINDDEKYGFIDVSGNIVVPLKYDWIYDSFNEGCAAVSNYKSDESLLVGYINEKGEEIVSPQYSWGEAFKDGYAAATQETSDNGVQSVKAIAFDKSGKIVIPAKYSYLYNCGSGCFGAVLRRETFALVNSENKRLTPYKYSSISEFNEGVAAVTTGFSNKGEEVKVGAINEYGNEIIPLEYTAMTAFHNGKALIGQGKMVDGRLVTERIGIVERPETADYDSGKSLFVTVMVDGEEVEFDQDPVIINGRTLVPMRAIFEAMGSQVSWDQMNRRVTGIKDDTTVTLTIGQTDAYVNGKEETLDVPASLMNDRTMVPARFIAQSFGADVQWDQETKIVTITSKSE